MKFTKTFIIATVLLAAFLSTTAHAENEKILVIMDCSTGMNRDTGGEKIIYAAQKELIKFVGSLKPDTNIGIMLFGHTSKKCDDAELIIPFGYPDPEKLKDKLLTIRPTGNRGLVDAIEKGLTLLGETYDQSTLYLITSGLDECGTRLWHVEEAYQKYGKNTRIIVIGIDLDARDSDKLKDMVASVNGTYQDAQTTSQLSSTMKNIVDSMKGSLMVVVRGLDPENPKAELKVYNDQSVLLQSIQIDGFQSMNLSTGIYDLMLTYRGKNFWNRQVFINEDSRKEVVFDLSQANGELRISIVDMNGERIRGNVTVYDDLNNTVYEGKGQSEYLISVPVGTYFAEIKSGDVTETYDYIEVYEDSPADVLATVLTQIGTAEIVVNNFDGIPINASILIEDMDGNTVGKVDFSSTYLVNLSSGEYQVTVTGAMGQQEVTTFYMPEGDNITVDINIESPIGSIVVYLTTTEGNEVFGKIKVFDEKGRVIPHFEYESIEDSMFTFDLPVGTYRIQATVEGYMRTMDGVSVNENDETEVYLSFPDSLK